MERGISILTNLTSRVSESLHTFKEDQEALINLVENLKHLGHLIETRMRMSAKEERERACNLAAALVNGKKALQEAEILRKTLEDTRAEHGNSVDQVRAEMNREMKLLDGIKLQQTVEITQRTRQLEVQMRTLIEKRQIEAEIEQRDIEYRSTCAINLKSEKKLFTKRKEVERYYLGILAKYDREVGELYRTMESLMEESDLLADKLKKLEETLRIQEMEYVELKNERETAIRQAFEESLNNFRRQWAVKRIQRIWRAYWERQQLKKKRKSKKKKQ